MIKKPLISIITPSYNMLRYLKLSTLSVGDQKISHEHIVVDACSTDGTKEYLKNNKNIRSVIEKDTGMYDALNKGFKLAKGEIIGHLNCDEQYLPGTLKFVKDAFENNSNIDMVFGDYLTVNRDGTLNAFKKTIPYRKNYILNANFYIGTCALFYRSRIIDDGNFFDISFNCAGDKEYVVRLHELGYKSLSINKYLSCFTVTGKNLSQSEKCKNEDQMIRDKYLNLPLGTMAILSFAKKLEKVIRGAYSEKDIIYSLFLKNSKQRTSFRYSKADFVTKFH